MSKSDDGSVSNCRRPYIPYVSNSMKTWIAFLLGLLFFLIAYGGTYDITNTVAQCLCWDTYLCAPGCPSTGATLVHAIIFALLIRLCLW